MVVAACIGPEIGRVTARGFGFDRSQRASTTVAFAVIEPRVAVAVRRAVWLDAGLGLWIPLVRPRFTFDQGGTPIGLYHAPAVGLDGQIGVEWRF